ncbi:MAG: ribbon-helix-helix domain-containing protein [Actinobacteria bacterium]|nr:ribbon-helix-helix domain-containing protein [Actinomycetota bacterium]
MVRTQVQLTEEQYKKLKKKAAIEGVSMSELVREGVDHVLSTRVGPGDDELRTRALEIMGKFKSGKKDVARRHDDYLAEDYR